MKELTTFISEGFYKNVGTVKTLEWFKKFSSAHCTHNTKGTSLEKIYAVSYIKSHENSEPDEGMMGCVIINDNEMSVYISSRVGSIVSPFSDFIDTIQLEDGMFAEVISKFKPDDTSIKLTLGLENRQKLIRLKFWQCDNDGYFSGKALSTIEYTYDRRTKTLKYEGTTRNS